MRGIQISGYHTADDWNLIMTAKKINPPEPKLVKVAVNGRDGDLNLSRTLTGEIMYKNRDASFSFLLTDGTQEERQDLIKTITRAVHGKELQIIEPDNEDYYLFGECSIENVVNHKAYGSFTISAECEPYYQAINEVNRILAPSSKPFDVVLSNIGDKILTPVLTVEDNINLEFGTTKVSLGQGTYKLTALKLPPGDTIVTMTGAGFVYVKYREAVLA